MAKQLNVSEIKLNMAQPRMLTVQLVDELRRLIARDSLDGTVLPSARQLANTLKLNRLTVGRAYAELENRGSSKGDRRRFSKFRRIFPGTIWNPIPISESSCLAGFRI